MKGDNDRLRAIKSPDKKPRVDITHTCLTANPTALVGVCDCATTKRISCEKSGPTSDVRSEFVVVAVQQAVQNVRDVTLVHFGSQHPRLVGHLVVIVRLEGAAGRREMEKMGGKDFLSRKVGSIYGSVVSMEKYYPFLLPSVHPSMQCLGPTHVLRFAEQPNSFLISL